MNKEEDIVAFTFSELAFMLMYAIFASYFLVEGLSENKISALESELAALRKQTVVRKSEYDELKKKEELKSKQTPSCIEKKIQRTSGGVGILFEVSIIDATSYLVDGVEHDFNNLIRKFNIDIENAKKCGCFHSITIKHLPNINIEEYLSAKNRLAQYFYINER